MKKNYLYIFTIALMLFPQNINGKELKYQSIGKKEISEYFTHTEEGFIYHYIEGKKRYQLILQTNENFASISFTNIIEENTNAAYLVNNFLIVEQEKKNIYINLQNLELILFPEIQLKNFILDPSQTNMKYITIELNNYKSFVADINKITNYSTNINNIPHSKAEITFDKASSNKLIKFIYYFNPQGIATIKEGYTKNAMTPTITLIKNI